MPVKYENFKGDVYYLIKKKTKKVIGNIILPKTKREIW